MAYTHTWNSTTPLGSAAAADLDANIRDLKLDIEERLDDLLGIASFTADPLVATLLRLNRQALTKILIGSTSTTVRDSADSIDLATFKTTGVDFPLQFGPNATISGGLVGTTLTFNFNQGLSQGYVGLNVNANIVLQNLQDGKVARVGIINDGTAGRTLTFTTAVRWIGSGGVAPVWNTVASAVNFFNLFNFAGLLLGFGIPE